MWDEGISQDLYADKWKFNTASHTVTTVLKTGYHHTVISVKFNPTLILLLFYQQNPTLQFSCTGTLLKAFSTNSQIWWYIMNSCKMLYLWYNNDPQPFFFQGTTQLNCPLCLQTTWKAIRIFIFGNINSETQISCFWKDNLILLLDQENKNVSNAIKYNKLLLPSTTHKTNCLLVTYVAWTTH